MKRTLLALLSVFLALPFAGLSIVPTPTSIPTAEVPKYFPPVALAANPISAGTRESWYVFDASKLDAEGVRMGLEGTHLVNPEPGSIKLPFGAWVKSVVQGPTEIAFTEAVTPLPTPVAAFQFGCGAASSDHHNDWLGINFVCSIPGMSDVTQESAGDLADLGVNWWRYVGLNDDYDARNIVNPDALPVSFTVLHGDLRTGRVMFDVQWTVPPTAKRR